MLQDLASAVAMLAFCGALGFLSVVLTGGLPT